MFIISINFVSFSGKPAILYSTLANNETGSGFVMMSTPGSMRLTKGNSLDEILSELKTF